MNGTGGNCLGLTWNYDAWGNRTAQNVTSGTCNTSSLGFNSSNRIISPSGYQYDLAGDMTKDASHSYSYDAEGRVTQVDPGSTPTATYVYDAEGRRVRKTVSGVSVDYLYDLAGHVITEVNSSGGWNRGEVFAGGKHIATYNNGTTYFTHADWIGTERARTDASGNEVETCTGLPFGDGQSCSGGDVSPLHFAGKQRDTETGLDDFNARYYASTAGRFMSPDWSAKPQGVPYAQLADPQSLNLYVYVRDNPITGLDLDGHGQGRDRMQGKYCSQYSTCKVQGESTDNGENASSPPPPKPTQQKVNNLTVADVAGIVFNETFTLTNSGTQNDSTDTARTDVASAIINADVKYGDKRDELAGTAPSTVTKADMAAAAYKSSLAAAKAAYGDWQAGKDPTGGATHFNLRGTPSEANFLKSKTNPGFAIKTHSGPFNNSYHPPGGLPATGVYVNTYE